MKFAQVFKNTLAAAVLAGTLSFAAAPAAHAGVFVSVGIAPPAIPVYEQPVAPGYGYIWTPGYWAYGPDGYYWMDGAWVYPPYEGALWTPGYWGWGGDAYLWYPGYWGRTVGYYGGINYGFGYFGVGFWGGYWNGGHFFYNSAYNHIGFHNAFVYNRPVAGFNGRPGGIAYARTEGGVNRGAAGFNRGNGFAENRGAANGGSARTAFNGGQARAFTGGNTQIGGNSGAQARSFSGGGANGGQARSFSGGASGGQARGSSGGGAHASGSHGGGGHR